MTIFEIIIIWLFAASLIANFLYVIFNRQMGRYTLRWDLFRWISAYQLFSESPRHLKLLYRDKLPNDKLTDWKEVRLNMPRKWYHLIFFPEFFVVEIIYAFIDDLINLYELKKDARTISKNFIYQTILRYIRRFPATENSIARQFKIEEAQGFTSSDNVQHLFTSEFHIK